MYLSAALVMMGWLNWIGAAIMKDKQVNGSKANDSNQVVEV